MKTLDRIVQGWNTANVNAKDLLDLICENEYLERRNDELIASKPEMLAALQALLEEAEGLICAYHGAYGSTPDDDCVINEIKALEYARLAIAKATKNQ
jgi:hypothetical protein